MGPGIRGTKEGNNVALPDWNKIISERIRQYKPGSIAFNPQNIMRVTHKYTVEAVISNKSLTEGTKLELKSNIKDKRFVQYTSLKYISEFMKLQLVAASPDDFIISPAEPVEKNVNGGAEHWSWQVQPTSTGDKTLKLKVLAVIKNYDLRDVCSKDIVELEKPIKVKIVPSYIPETILNFTDKHQKTLQWIFGGGFGATFLGLLINRFRKPDSNNSTPSDPKNDSNG